MIGDGPLLCQESGKHSTIRQADSSFGGVDAQEIPGETTEAISAFVYVRLPSS